MKYQDFRSENVIHDIMFKVQIFKSLNMRAKIKAKNLNYLH